MIDAVGNVGSILIIGGSSAVGVAVVDRLVGPRLARVVLADEPSADLAEAASHIRNLGVISVATPVYEPLETHTHGRLIDSIFDSGDIDVVVLATDQRTSGEVGYGSADDQQVQAAAEVARVNYTASVSVGLHLARRFRKQGHGALVVISSVCAALPRQRDFVYASSKAGLDSFAVGLAESMRDSGARVIVARVGFIATDGNAVRERRSFTTDPATVASSIAGAIRARKQETIYVPASVRTAMSGMRYLPRVVARRLHK